MTRFLFAFAILTCHIQAQDSFQTLRKEHPRLIWTQPQIVATRQIIATDPVAKEWHAKIVKTADGLLAKPLVAYDLSNKKLLVESRAVLERVTTFAGLYLLDGDKRFLDAAKKEMLNAAAFQDWNPASFLSTAEMTNALALGYDWLHQDLTATERDTIRTAIIEKGLKPGLAVHATGRGWPHVKHNWNAVCNGGLAIGALAIADTDPAIAGEILAAVRKSLPRGMLDFAPDGGWPEGPGYWDYTTTYNAFSFASMKSALGTDFDFTKSPGFSDTGNFRIQLIGNTGLNFNFADAPVRPSPAPQMFWLAGLFGRPAYDAHERLIAGKKPGIFHLIWFNPKFSGPEAKAALDAIPSCVQFKGTQTVILRSGTPDQQTFVGIKGGNNRVNHAHLDLGSFVLDHRGQRFAEELGPDLYTLPGYFGTSRWTYYRLRTEGQNTLTLDGQNQDPKAAAKVISFEPDGKNPRASFDLTAAYPGAEKVHRLISLAPDGSATLTDEITTKSPVDVTWHLHTEASAELKRNTARLTRGKVTLLATILSPANATFSFAPLEIPPPQRAAGKLNKLTVSLPEKTRDTTIVVKFTPEDQ